MRLRWKVGPASYVETLEHREIAGASDDDQRVVHRDGDLANNDPDNLEVVGRSELARRQGRESNARSKRETEWEGARSQHAYEKRLRAAERRRRRAEEDRGIAELYRAGRSMPEIAAIVGRHSSNVLAALRRAGVKSRRPSDYAPPIDVDLALHLYLDDRLPPEAIAARLGVASARVRRLLRSRGVMRGSGRPADSRPSFPAEFDRARPIVLARARYECEVGIPDVCTTIAGTVHHRKMRSQGGSNDLVNLLAVCAACHTQIHARPARSYRAGWLVRSTHDPAAVPRLSARSLGMTSAADTLEP